VILCRVPCAVHSPLPAVEHVIEHGVHCGICVQVIFVILETAHKDPVLAGCKCEVADFISESEPLKAAVRVCLKPLVAFAVYALEPSLAVEQLPFIVMGIASASGIAVVVVRNNKKRKRELE
jgi:positive regulator of sigma E activity